MLSSLLASVLASIVHAPKYDSPVLVCEAGGAPVATETHTPTPFFHEQNRKYMNRLGELWVYKKTMLYRHYAHRPYNDAAYAVINA